MVRYVKTIDELVDIVDRELSGKNAVCPICKHKIGSVNIPHVELGMPELHFMEFKHPGIFCTNGHCVIAVEEEQDGGIDRNAVHEDKREDCKLHIEDVGIKVFEVMKLIKPYLGLDDSIPNTQIYWMLMDRENPVYTKEMSRRHAADLMDKLQKLGARVEII